MKTVLLSFLLFLPAFAAAEQRRPPETPESIARLKKEAAELERQAASDPKNADIFVRLGFTYARLKQADDAQRAFETVVSLDPKSAKAHYMLGLIYEKKGMKDRALSAWRACLENASDPAMRATATRHIHNLAAGK
ncbi:MAG: tetratricopeptide repeat protein [Elusimicrobiales bacterium]|jgi:cytochrome c-type biogenesis protein CcmH/NrfG|nr:tetratricopeptide repeat protein [Elusimicrobiales bacterium]